MKWWKREGPNRLTLGEWAVIKNWHDPRWSVYRNDNPVEGHEYDTAQLAIEAAEKLIEKRKETT